MPAAPHDVLVAVRDGYDATGDPLDCRDVATVLGTAPSRVAPVLCALDRADFLAVTADGYRPTVTARELLELEVHLDDVAIVDVIDE